MAPAARDGRGLADGGGRRLANRWIRLLAWLPFPGLLLLALWLITPSADEPTDLGLSLFLVTPAVLVYGVTLPILVRGLRKARTRRVAAFSTGAALLWFLVEAISLWLISGPVWRASGYLSDLLFFWFLPWAPAALAIGVGYWWARRHTARA